MKYTLTVPIAKLEEKFDYVNWRKDESGRPTSTRISLGWYVQFEGSTESIFLQEEMPEWQVGDMIKITFTKVPI